MVPLKKEILLSCQLIFSGHGPVMKTQDGYRGHMLQTGSDGASECKRAIQKCGLVNRRNRSLADAENT